MEAPPPLKIRFFGGAPITIVCVAVAEAGATDAIERPSATAGETVAVSVQARTANTRYAR